MKRGSDSTGKFYKNLWQAILLMPLVLLGCTTTPVEKESGPLFYPSLPNPPRIQFLKTYSNKGDLGRVSSGLAKFIAGEESKRSDLINKPYGVAIHKGKIYVADTRGAAYVILDLQKNEHRIIGGDAGGRHSVYGPGGRFARGVFAFCNLFRRVAHGIPDWSILCCGLGCTTGWV